MAHRWQWTALLLLCCGCPTVRPAATPDLTALLPAVQRIVRHVTTGRGRGRAYNDTADFADRFGHRLVGSANLENSIDALLAQLQGMGLDETRQEAVTVPHWVRGEESAELLQPLVGNATKPLPIKGFGMSVATPAEGITAEALVVTDWADLWARRAEVPGKIVVFSYAYRGYDTAVLYRACSHLVVRRLGGLASLVRSPTAFSIASPHTGSTRRAPYAVASPDIPAELCGNYTEDAPTAGLTAEDAEMLLRMARRGGPIRLRLVMRPTLLPAAGSRNVVAAWTGTAHPEQVVLLSGHIDSWDVGQGAMDDLGPLLVAREAVRVLAELNLRTLRTVRFVAFVGEEFGGNSGGQQYFAAHQQEIADIVLVSELDEGIWNVDGILAAASEEALAILRAIAEVLRPLNASQVGARGSVDTLNGLGADVGAWTKHGVPTITLAQHPNMCWQPPAAPDGVGSWDGPTPPQHFQGDYFFFHHTDGDTMSVLDTDQMDRAVAVLAVYAYLVASLPEPLPRGPFVPMPTSAPAGAGTAVSPSPATPNAAPVQAGFSWPALLGAMAGSLAVGVALGAAASRWYAARGRRRLEATHHGGTSAHSRFEAL
eukprot:EG_transcript_5312